MTVRLDITGSQFENLRNHLFQSDHDEHGAILLAGLRSRPEGEVLLTREVHTLADHEFSAGDQGYRQFTAVTLARLGNRAADQGLALVTCHSHPAAVQRVSLSGDDLKGHQRVFPHLLDIVNGSPVAGVAFGQDSAAGEFWTQGSRPMAIERVRVHGDRLHELSPRPSSVGNGGDGRFDRQVRMFGEAGQAILRNLRVGVIGAGGGGSMIIEQLAHLGVGTIAAIDFDVVKDHNLSRVVGAKPEDARRRCKKVQVAARLVRSIDPSIRFLSIDGDIADAAVARRLAECDFIFLATDTITSRLVANAVALAHHIPLIQIGAKVDLRPNREIESVYVAVRPVIGGRGCLACAGLIDPLALQRENASPEEGRAQNYLGVAEVIDPSVITLNGIAASTATNAMLMYIVGLADEELLRHRLFDARTGRWLMLSPARDPACLWCGDGHRSRFGRGDQADLPTRASQPTEAALSRTARILRRIKSVVS